mgnify:FL=1
MAVRESWIKRALMAVLIGLLVISGVFMINGYFAGSFHSVEAFRAYVGKYGMFAPVVLGCIQMLQVVVPVIPGMVGCAAGAGMFGAVQGFWCNYIGISAGSIVAFLLAKWFGEKIVNVMVPVGKYQSWVDRLNSTRYFTWILFLSILLPLAPDDFLCYFSGLGGMSTKKFVWIIVLAKPWCILAYSIFFAYFAK